MYALSNNIIDDYLKDTVKPGTNERFERLRIGIKNNYVYRDRCNNDTKVV